MMRRALRALALALVVILLLLVLVAGSTAVVTVRRPFPQTSGQLTVPGLSASVEILRDAHGIPHVYAESEPDLYFAQGFVHAQDRFWQMEFWRHIGQGRIAEIAGGSAVSSDRFIRTMGWNRIAQDTLAYYETEDPAMLAIMEAYSAGVNAYIAQNRNRLSVNFQILGLVNEPWDIEPWTPLDTISWSVVMSDDLSGNWRHELDRVILNKAVGEARVASLWPFYPYDDRPVIAPTPLLWRPDGSPPEPDENPEQEAIRPGEPIDWARIHTGIVSDGLKPAHTLGQGPFVGSNNWVVAGKHTASGWPLLANDPHLGLQLPAIWYEIGLHGPDGNVVGFSFAGVPGVIIGHNDHIAWGVTNVGPDVQDLYIEKVNPSNPRQYEFRGGWRDMMVFEEVIKVNGGADVVLEVLATHHGPIISDLVDGQQDVLALRWTAQEPSRILRAIYLLNQAADFEGFREALRYWDTPSQNIVYADVAGNIGYQVPGLMPIRPRSDGLAPVPGWTGENEWQGWIPYDELPVLFNPEQGFIVTANHAVVDQDYPHFLARYWADGDRGQRITDLLTTAIAAGPLEVEDMARIQFDSYSLMAERFMPVFRSLSSPDPEVQAAIERIRGWDRQLRRDSVPAAVFEIFYQQLVTAVLVDDVGTDNVSRAHSRVFMHQLAGQADAVWWDNRQTAASETREIIVLQALRQALDWFEEEVGGELNDWTWGRIHQATFVSAPVGQSGVAPIEALVNRGPFPTDGGTSIVNAYSWSWDSPAAVENHPSMRFIADLGDFDASRAVLPTGQSGHPYHPHYDDMIPPWLNGETLPLRFSRVAVEGAAVDRLILTPTGQ